MTALAAGGAPRYRPRSASNALDIVGDTLEDLLRLWEERFNHGARPPPPRVPPPRSLDTAVGWGMTIDSTRGGLRLGRPLFLLESILAKRLKWPIELRHYGAEPLSRENLELL